jgi:RHS repeat-associated protein
MGILTQVASALQALFGTMAQEAAGHTPVVLRRRKFTTATLAQTFVFGFLKHPNATDEQLAQTAGLFGAHVTTQSVLDRIDYDAFGNVEAESVPASGDRFKYAGREHDTATGLYYNRARCYDPGTGRFLGEDPIGFGGGDANLYRYVGNSPTNATDPTGLIAQSDGHPAGDPARDAPINPPGRSGGGPAPTRRPAGEPATMHDSRGRSPGGR